MKQDRLQALLSRLSLVGTMTLLDAMELLNISESTARRMFAQLEAAGTAIRTHGGIRYVEFSPTAYSFEYLARRNIEKKTAIGACACGMVEDGDVIFCDSGTTIQCFCAELVNRIRKEKLEVKVYTNSFANLELLSPWLTVNLVGGEYRANRKDFCGHLTEQALKGLYFTKSFLGADGCVEGRIFTTTDFDTMRMNEIAIANSRQTYMLVDSSKFKQSSHVAYTTAEQLHTVITDSQISPEALEQLKESKTRVLCAPVPNKE